MENRFAAVKPVILLRLVTSIYCKELYKLHTVSNSSYRANTHLNENICTVGTVWRRQTASVPIAAPVTHCQTITAFTGACVGAFYFQHNSTHAKHVWHTLKRTTFSPSAFSPVRKNQENTYLTPYECTRFNFTICLHKVSRLRLWTHPCANRCFGCFEWTQVRGRAAGERFSWSQCA